MRQSPLNFTLNRATVRYLIDGMHDALGDDTPAWVDTIDGDHLDTSMRFAVACISRLPPDQMQRQTMWAVTFVKMLLICHRGEDHG